MATAVIMGLLIYSTSTLGKFKAPSGTRITLKSHSGLLGCSVHPYVIQGITEHLVFQEDNFIHCFTFLDERPIKPRPVDAVSWSPDEAQLILTIDQEDYSFELAPTTAP